MVKNGNVVCAILRVGLPHEAFAPSWTATAAAAANHGEVVVGTHAGGNPEHEVFGASVCQSVRLSRFWVHCAVAVDTDLIIDAVSVPDG
jgi:hypothetical protein